MMDKYGELLLDIVPLKLTAEDQKYKGLPGRVYYSVNESRAKKFVASTSIKLDKQLRSMSLSQAITLALEPSELTHKIYYIQCFTRGGDKEKVQPCLESFVDRMLLENCVVVICAKSGIISCADSWVNLDKSSKSAE